MLNVVLRWLPRSAAATMKYLDEYRDPGAASRYVDAIAALVRQKWTLMEVCGGQTHAIVRYGLHELLPSQVEIVHGPGCPVCVTPAERISRALDLARRPNVILCSFGDMLRVPAGDADLLRVRAEGGDVRVVYSPLDALQIATQHPDRDVVFFAVGFETTAPAIAMTVQQAARLALPNFSVLVSHVRVPQALDALLSDPDNRVQGFLAAGHVNTIMGMAEYEPIARAYRVPIVATGFEPLDILQGVYMCLRQLEEGRAEVENQYTRAVRPAGNEAAITALQDVFEVVDRVWRGMGTIAASGLGLAAKYARFDADRRFDWTDVQVEEDSARCIAGSIMRGHSRPSDCAEFGAGCTPDHPLGAPMVSSEGACAAYFRYGVA